MDPLHSSVMAVHPPLDLDGCLSYICAGSLRSSPILARTDIFLRSSFSLSQAPNSQRALGPLVVLDTSPGCDFLLCEDSRSSSLPAASIHDSTNIIPVLNACSCPPSPLTVPILFRCLALLSACRTRFSQKIPFTSTPPWPLRS